LPRSNRRDLVRRSIVRRPSFWIDRLYGIDQVGLTIELDCHCEQNCPRSLGYRAAGHETTMCGVTPEVPRFVVHPP
ncbi:MAG TPA: hypothetical protein VGF45_05975, partial [Polyangia bacterium]